MTVSYYSAVDSNRKTFTNILSAINDNNGSSLVSCSVSIIRSTFKLPEPSIQSQNSIIKTIDTENLPRLDLFISTRTTMSTTPMFSNKNIYNNTLNGQNFTRTITRADHNGTIQCQIESNNCSDIYIIKTVSIGIECKIKNKTRFFSL
ncbi:unnamed protein product [Rotaria sp. Silwood1]|nr:unnamed protein product [Rotaria sp. Silwood1]